MPKKNAVRLLVSLPILTALIVTVLVGWAERSGGPALAATFTVTKTADTADGTCDSDCSLREAIIAANDASGADTITLPAGTYILTIAGASEDASATGDLDIASDVTINGAGAATTIIDGGAIDRVFDVPPSGGGTLELSGVTVQGGGNVPAPSDGGGIRIWFTTLTLTDSVVRNNVAGNQGGGIYNQSGSLTVIRSTISGNQANTGGGISVVSLDPSLVLTNSTVSGNVATGSGGGGLVFTVSTDGSLTLTNSTITNNTGVLAAGFRNLSGGTFVTLTNTIVAQNVGSTNCSGVISSLGYNLASDGTCNLTGTGDLPNTDPMLGPLQDNSGPTETHALLSGSLAIDAGDDVAAPTTDQRGFPRVGISDIGAYEFQGVPEETPTATEEAATSTPTTVATATHTPTASATIEATATPTPTASATIEVTPTPTPTAEPAATNTPALPFEEEIPIGERSFLTTPIPPTPPVEEPLLPLLPTATASGGAAGVGIAPPSTGSGGFLTD